MKTVVVTGADGYCGWPVVLKLLKNGHRVIGVDNGGRRQWVNEVKGQSVINISDINSRYIKAKDVYKNYEYLHMELSQYPNVHKIIDDYKPDAVLHLASQPSAPFSSIDVAHANFTQQNNNAMLMNIMWALNNLGLDDTHLIVTTTTGIYGAPDIDIPEGWLVINKMKMPFPAMAGSWYHMSRANDANNLWLGNRLFKFPISELRTSIVCGSSTAETREYPEFRNRFDIDFYFGVVVHRFVAQALSTKHLSVYGKGLQSKPMISLEDMVRSTVNCFELAVGEKDEKYRIYNQMEKEIAIVDIANTIKDYCEEGFNTNIKVDHVPNPRVEDEEHKMVMDNRKFILELCDNGIEQTVFSSIQNMCKDLYPYKDMITNILQRGK